MLEPSAECCPLGLFSLNERLRECLNRQGQLRTPPFKGHPNSLGQRGTIEIELPERFGRLSLHALGGAMTGALKVEGSRHRLALRDVPLYEIGLLTAD